ncbi:MAG: hypothetical protein ACLPY1_01390 [Terracidiphilus sp.]
MMDRVIVRFKRPNGAGRKVPSESLNQAMVSLADSDEMRPLLCEANAQGKALAIDIYQSRSGRPLLVHFNKEAL